MIRRSRHSGRSLGAGLTLLLFASFAWATFSVPKNAEFEIPGVCGPYPLPGEIVSFGKNGDKIKILKSGGNCSAGDVVLAGYYNVYHNGELVGSQGKLGNEGVVGHIAPVSGDKMVSAGKSPKRSKVAEPKVSHHGKKRAKPKVRHHAKKKRSRYINDGEYLIIDDGVVFDDDNMAGGAYNTQ